MRIALLVLVVVLVASPVPAGRRPDPDVELASLCRAVVERSQVRTAQHGPFELRAKVRVHTSRGPAEGSYRLLWLCDGEWREELVLPGLTAGEGETGGATWEERTE